MSTSHWLLNTTQYRSSKALIHSPILSARKQTIVEKSFAPRCRRKFYCLRRAIVEAYYCNSMLNRAPSTTMARVEYLSLSTRPVLAKNLLPRTHQDFRSKNSFRSHSKTNIPFRLKHNHNMPVGTRSSTKRPLVDSFEQSSKRTKIDDEKKAPTSHGLEDLLVDSPVKLSSKINTTSKQDSYRSRLGRHATMIRKLRTRVELPLQAFSFSSDFFQASFISNNQKMPAASQVGMKNLTGVLCYRHSLFQMLFHEPKVIGWLRYHGLSKCKSFYSNYPCLSDSLQACGVVQILALLAF